MILCGGLVKALEEDIEGVYEELANVVVRARSPRDVRLRRAGAELHESMLMMFGVLMFSNKRVRPSEATRGPE